MTIVLIEPKRIRNCSLVVLFRIADAIIAAWEEPSPGNREQIGEIRIVAIVGFIISFFEMFSFLIFCLGRIVFDFIEWIRVDVAKSPVRSGRSGFCMFKFRVVKPRSPAKENIIIAFILDSFSFKTRNIAIQIRKIPIMRWRKG